jgi:hypothetical protein
MQDTDKFRTDLDRAIKRARSAASGTVDLEALRTFFYGSFRNAPEESLAAFFSTFIEKWRADEEEATGWLASVGSILLMDYDGRPLSKADWQDIRESMALSAGEADLELLSYVMTLVVDHGAIH